jgi:hypothetical protein
MSTDGSTFDTVLAVYRGPNVASLTLVTDDDDDGDENASRVMFNASAGQLYHIAVDGYGPASGHAVLNLNPGGNDDFAQCFPLSGMSGSLGGYSRKASKEVGEPDHAGNSGGRSLWFCWTPASTEPVELTTSGSAFDTLLAVYTGGNLGSLSLVVSDNDSLDGNLSRLTFLAMAGATYRIAVDGAGDTGGVCFLNWRPLPRFLAPRRLPDNSLQLEIFGAIGDQCLIETSSNLTSWTLWRRVTNTSGMILLIDSLDGASHRFFRLRRE